MDTEPTLQEQIVLRAQELFFTRGFSSVTTDMIAAELGISKKTLYQHFTSKEELLHACMRKMREDMAGALERVVEKRNMDFVVKLRTLMSIIAAKISRVHRPMFDDMRRKAPELMREIEEFRRTRILPMFERLFAQGARRGKLRSDVDPHLFVMMFYALVERMMSPDTLAQIPYTAAEVYRAVVAVMLEGMLTEEAKVEFVALGEVDDPGVSPWHEAVVNRGRRSTTGSRRGK